MTVSRRQLLRTMAFFSVPLGTGAYLFLHKPPTYEAVKDTIAVAFGSGILSHEDFERFADDLVPLLPAYLAPEDLKAAFDWSATVDSHLIAEGDQVAITIARERAEETPRRFTRFVATRFVEATDFAFDPTAKRLSYLGLSSNWPSMLTGQCAPLVDYEEDDGWAL